MGGSYQTNSSSPRQFKEAGLTEKVSKCHFGVTECSYLGFVVGGGLVKLEPPKVQVVLDFPTPTDKTGVGAFLGLTMYRLLQTIHPKLFISGCTINRPDEKVCTHEGQLEQGV